MFQLRDRLNICSDNQNTWVCKVCGSLLAPLTTCTASNRGEKYAANKTSCRVCEASCKLESISVPHVFIYLAAELAAMNISIQVKSS